MPTYQYRCTSCGRDLEVVQKFTDPTLTECPACHGELRKVFNAVGVVFKGSGFYRTDSRSADNSADTKVNGSGSSEKSESAKPAEKSEATSGSGTTAKPSGEKSGGSGSTSGSSGSTAAKAGSN